MARVHPISTVSAAAAAAALFEWVEKLDLALSKHSQKCTKNGTSHIVDPE